MLHGQLTEKLRLAGVPMLALSSMARTRIGVLPRPFWMTVAVHDVVPVAACHVAPLSLETSTPATRPAASAAVPVRVTRSPFFWDWPAAGVLIVTVGPAVSVDFVAAARPVIRVAGCAPMSASRLTCACCMRESVELSGYSESCSASRPYVHWIVPALKTRAPLGALYIVML